MIGSVYLLRAGSFALSGLGCGLAANLLKGRKIANWTWMSSTMTFQQGAMIGCGLAVVEICVALFLRIIKKSSWLTDSQKLLAKTCILSIPLGLLVAIYMFKPLPVFSFLTFRIVSGLSDLACQPKPPFYQPPGWNSVSISRPDVEFCFHRSENGIIRQWIVFTEQNYSESLENYKNELLTQYQKLGWTAKVLGPFTPSKDPGILLEAVEPDQQGGALLHQLLIVKEGVAYTLIVGSRKDEFDQYAELFKRVLCSLRLEWDWSSTAEEKKQQLQTLYPAKV
ncbi:MAG TPA: hypothetical protein VHK67_07710 [Rhabdochlamydiaceae bacterium]|jgi:hypothetical protein|nr:hypothetical protein [Rhabdochlamydiaceae bacterium]